MTNALRQKTQTPQNGDAQEEKEAEKRQTQEEIEQKNRRITKIQMNTDRKHRWPLDLSVLICFFICVNLWYAGFVYAVEKKAFTKSLAHYTMGLIYDFETRIDEAVKEYTNALEYDNKQPSVYLRLGVDYIILGDHKKAEEALKASKRFGPLDTRPRVLLALIYSELKKVDHAQREYEGIIKLNPESLHALSSLADLYVIGKKLKEASLIYEELLARNKGKGEAAMLHFNLGIIYAKMGRIGDAISQLEETLKLEPDNLQLNLILGFFYSQNSQFEKAKEAYKKVLALEPKNSMVNFYMGAACARSGENQEAVDYLKKAIQFDEKNAEAYNYLGYIYAEDGVNLDEAVWLIKKALELEPESGAYLDSLGWAYFKKGLYKEALVELEKAVRLEPNDPTIKEHLETVRKKLK